MKDLVERVKKCTKCKLHVGRRNPVVGRGSLYSKVMFIGEAPGYHEDVQGLPFVGAAGKLLSQLLASVGINEQEVYITNVVKCRPPENRDPEPDEIEACTPYLDEQIKIISPAIIVTLGRHSANYIFSKAGWNFSSIEKIRGKVRIGKILGLNIIVIPTYHPAAALYNPALKAKLEQDLRMVKEELIKPRLF
ncbi:MAG: uracil-DNA glycosylase [Candidatus Methanomethylicota archaeon]|uniref:Type-4 uracil-DNA glycosylase n=1 Tax=Thermoproteota archaeon TaxID=2056631 RepID=A0A497EZ43_9CREN|nr:MAG: uracil-DNA glycosylase [Candidatus Verstraetearchaeota archaeon]RLE52291.1 MAG: uracil-DNA glycosylase [Candidatus Verstraetearchaeota archaeon]